jgi:hypothetical protein
MSTIEPVAGSRRFAEKEKQVDQQALGWTLTNYMVTLWETGGFKDQSEGSRRWKQAHKKSPRKNPQLSPEPTVTH